MRSITAWGALDDLEGINIGQATIPLGASSIAVTWAPCTTATMILATLAQVDATALYIKAVVASAGTFTIHTNANATADTTVNWAVIGILG